MMVAPVPRPLPAVLTATALALTAAFGAAHAVAADRPAGRVSDWSHELNQEELPQWRLPTAPLRIGRRRGTRIIDGILTTAGDNGLDFSGVSALPFPPLPLSPKETIGWRTPSRFLAQYRRSGLSWDVAVEVWAARNALNTKRAVVSDPGTQGLGAATVPARSGLPRGGAARDPPHRPDRALASPTSTSTPAATSRSWCCPHGKARRTPFGRRLAADFRRATGYALPDPNARRSTSVTERLRWLAWTRYSGRRFFAMKAEQAALIHRSTPTPWSTPTTTGSSTASSPGTTRG